MFVYDVFIEDRREDEDLTRAIAAILEIDAARISIVQEMEESVDKDPSDLFVQRHQIGGDFKMSVTIYEKERSTPVPQRRLASLMAKYLSCSVLCSANADNPCEWIHLSPAGDEQTVLLMGDALDNNNEAVLTAPERWPNR